MSGCLPVPFWASGHGVREGAGNVCCEWRGTRDIGQGSKLQECAVSTGAGYGTGTNCGGERQFPLRRFDVWNGRRLPATWPNEEGNQHLAETRGRTHDIGVLQEPR